MQEKCFFGLNPQGFHRIVYDEWGDDTQDTVVICVHGLTRNAGDFFWLADALKSDFRIACPDMVGRGRSDYLRDPVRYTYPQYMADLNVLLARLQAKNVLWVGTSMGGLLGMMLASLPQTPIKALVLNDIGPFVPADGLKRLVKYVPKEHVFGQFEEIKAFLRSTLLGYNDVNDLQWKQLAEQSTFWDPVTQKWQVRYDPSVASTLNPANITDQDFWKYWDTLTCPVLALQGGESDILTHDTVKQMARKPRTRIVPFVGQGHALSLATKDQIILIRDWLLGVQKTIV